VTAREIDGRFVPVPAPGITTVLVGLEAVVLDERTTEFHMLSGTAALIWDCFDGSTALGVAATEIVQVTSAPFEQVLRETLDLTRQCRALGLVRDARDAHDETGEPWVLGAPPPAAGAACPSWVEQRCRGGTGASLTVEHDGRRATVRAGEAPALHELGEILRPLVVAHDPSAPRVSIVVGAADGPRREMDRVFSGRVELCRTASRLRRTAAVLAQVDRLLAHPDDALELACSVLLDASDRAVLVDDRTGIMRVGDRRLARLGLRRLDLEVARIDRADLRLLVPELRLPVDGDALARLDDALRAEGERGLPAGPYPVRAVVLLGSGPDHLKVTSPARRAGSLVPMVTRVDGTASGRDLADAFRLAEQVEVIRALGLDVDGIVDALAGLAVHS
jgi:hypothetical protein